METSRANIASLILRRLESQKEDLTRQFDESAAEIAHFVLDDLLPENLVNSIYRNFPNAKNTRLKKNLREHKHVAYQMNNYASILEEVIYAFQDARVVQCISEICDLKQLEADKNLYAGGLSLMSQGHFLNPHLDNSHDKDRARWRVLNLLYYVTPNWQESYGGHLELWPNGLTASPIGIPCQFNRLVVMATHQRSWHSVRKVGATPIQRCCVSNYYFSDSPIISGDQFHITSFRGRPTERAKDVLLRIDTRLRSIVRKIFRNGIRENPHKYKQ